MIEAVPTSVKEAILDKRETIFEPFPKQAEFLASDEDHVLFGGGRAGGKTAAFIFDPLRGIHIPGFRALILRRTTKDLRDLVNRCRILYPKIDRSAVYKTKDNLFEFSSGATVEFGYLDSEQDVENYRGQEYAWIGIDEISQIPEFDWVSRLLGSLRSTKVDRTYFRATTNWTGIGVDWVKEYFGVEEYPENRTIREKSSFTTQDGETKELVVTKKWFNSTIFDNPIMAKDESYLAQLNAQPEHIRKAWLYGDTASIEGVAFPDFDPSIHVIEPFELDDKWKKFKGCDYGYGDGAAAVWIAINKIGEIVVYREYCANMKQHPVKQTAGEFSKNVLNCEIEADEWVLRSILDSSLYAETGNFGPSLAEEMIIAGIKWAPADKGAGSRVAGKTKIHDLLKINPATGKPTLRIFNNCVNLIKMFRSIPLDKNNAEDVDTHSPMDHVYDALRYILMARPSPKPRLIGNNSPIIYNSTVWG